MHLPEGWVEKLSSSTGMKVFKVYKKENPIMLTLLQMNLSGKFQLNLLFNTRQIKLDAPTYL